MTLTLDQVRAARDAGRAAGLARQSATTNPYSAEPLRPWELARLSPSQRAEHDRQIRERRALAHVWQKARRKAASVNP